MKPTRLYNWLTNLLEAANQPSEFLHRDKQQKYLGSDKHFKMNDSQSQQCFKVKMFYSAPSNELCRCVIFKWMICQCKMLIYIFKRRHMNSLTTTCRIQELLYFLCQLTYLDKPSHSRWPLVDRLSCFSASSGQKLLRGRLTLTRAAGASCFPKYLSCVLSFSEV